MLLKKVRITIYLKLKRVESRSQTQRNDLIKIIRLKTITSRRRESKLILISECVSQLAFKQNIFETRSIITSILLKVQVFL